MSGTSGFAAIHLLSDAFLPGVEVSVAGKPVDQNAPRSGPAASVKSSVQRQDRLYKVGWLRAELSQLNRLRSFDGGMAIDSRYLATVRRAT